MVNWTAIIVIVALILVFVWILYATTREKKEVENSPEMTDADRNLAQRMSNEER